MITSIRAHILKLIQDELRLNKWKPSDFFHDIKRLSIDQRGRVGEYFLRDVFIELNKNVTYIDNAHGDYDLEVDNIKIEVKTATLDNNNKFQHEGVKSSKLWDLVAFVDIAPNNLYITFIHKDQFNFNKEKATFVLHKEVRSAHYRGKDQGDKRATGAGYKVDFPLKKLIETKTIKDLENSFNNIFHT